MKNEFYQGFFGCSTEKATKFKIKYLKALIRDNTIFKFIQFGNEIDLNIRKLSALESRSLWFSHHRFLNDPTEYEMMYDAARVSSKTGTRKQDVDFVFGTLKDLYELCSFTYENSEHMWDIYSKKGNGICIEFTVTDYDFLYPVIYCEKSGFNFTEMIIQSILRLREPSHSLFDVNDPVSILRYILKNAINDQLDSTEEKEVRILYAPTDKSEFNDGVLYPNAKEQQGFNGLNVLWETVGLSIKSVIIGDTCTPATKEEVMRICAKNSYRARLREGGVYP